MRLDKLLYTFRLSYFSPIEIAKIILLIRISCYIPIVPIEGSGIAIYINFL